MLWLAVALGGALGATARYAVTRLVTSSPDGFPWATFVVNLLGCCAMGACLAWVDRGRVSPELRALVVTGLLGSFTTFSTFSAEGWTLVQDGRPGLAALYVAASLILGLAGVWLGRSLVA